MNERIRNVVLARRSVLTSSFLVAYLAVYLLFGVGGVSFPVQLADAYVRTTANTAPPAGAAWIEGGNFTWADGNTEYRIFDETGDNVTVVDTSSPGPAGAAWIEGDSLHWISPQGIEYAYTGRDTRNNPAGAQPGNAWIENGWLHYIDADGDEYIADTTPP